MPRFIWNWNYYSNLTAGVKGDEVDIPVELAEHIERDSPGALSAVKAQHKERAVDKPPSDRMVHAAPKTRAVSDRG